MANERNKEYRNYLLEYITPEQRKKYSAYKMTSVARKNTDHFFGVGVDKKVEEVPGLQPEKSEIHKKVEAHIGKELSHEEYNQGRTSDKYGRQAKLSKFITDQQLQKEFAADKSRQGAKVVSKPTMSIVRGVEVAGQTNDVPDERHPSGHSWGSQSCKNISTGSNRHYLAGEIQHGSVVVFGHDNDGKEIYRATLQPHHPSKSKKSVLYSLDSEYGVKHPAFTAHAHDVARRLSSIEPTTSVYEKHKEVYNDNGELKKLHPNLDADQLSKMIANGKHFNVTPEKQFRLSTPNRRKALLAVAHPNASENNLKAALDSNDTDAQYAAAQNPNVTSRLIHHVLDKPDTDRSWTVKNRVLNSSNATGEHLEKAFKSSSHMVRAGAVRNEKASADLISRGLNDSHHQVRSAAALNPNATSEHLHKAIKDSINSGDDGAWGVIRFSTSKNLKPEHLESAMNHRDETVRAAAVEHDMANENVLMKGLNDKNSGIRLAAANSSKATSNVLHKALEDKDPAIRRTAVLSDKATPEHIDKALSDRHFGVRMAAAGHDNASSENLFKALDSEDEEIRSQAATNKNLNSAHISKILKHERSGDVVFEAMGNDSKPVGPEHFHLAMNHEDHGVRQRFFSNNNKFITPEMISRGLKDKSHNVRTRALSHNNATPENMKDALDALSGPDYSTEGPDSDKRLSRKQGQNNIINTVASHPKVTSDLLHRTINLAKGEYNTSDLLHAAVRNPNATKEHHDAAIKIAKEIGDNLAVKVIGSMKQERYGKSKLAERNYMGLYRKKLLEYLTPGQKKEYSQYSMDPQARKYTDHFFGEGNDEVHLDVPNYTPDKSEVHTKVEKHIGSELSHEDYNQGMASDKYGRRVRLSKLIKDPALQKEFASDSTRAGSKTSAIKARIVRGVEVAGQTNPKPDEKHPNGHSWHEQSCKNIESGGYRHKLVPEIQKGSVVYFGTDHDGKEIYRATIHPHYKHANVDEVPTGGVAYSVDSEYGVKHPAFRAHAEEIARKLSSEPSESEIHHGDTLYSKHHLVYNDSGVNTIFNPKLTDEHLEKIVKNLQSAPKPKEFPGSSERHSNFMIDKIASHPSVGPKTMAALLQNPSSEIKEKLMANKMFPDSEKEKIISGDNEIDKSDLAYHNPNLSAEHVSRLVNQNNSGVLESLLVSPKNSKKLTNQHLDKFVSHPDSRIVSKAASHQNATGSQLHMALDTHPDSVYVAREVLRNKKHDASHIDKILDSSDSEVRATPFESVGETASFPEKTPKITSAHIEKAISKADPHNTNSVLSAISHPAINPETLSKIFKGEHPKFPVDKASKTIEQAIIHHSRYNNLSGDALNHAVNFASSKKLGRALAILADNKSATPEHLTKIADAAKGDRNAGNIYDNVFMNKNTPVDVVTKHIHSLYNLRDHETWTENLHNVLEYHKDNLQHHHIENIFNSKQIPDNHKAFAMRHTTNKKVLDVGMSLTGGNGASRSLIQQSGVRNKLHSPEELHRFQKSSDPKVRAAVVKNPNHDESHLDNAIRDASQEVRYAAYDSDKLNKSHVMHAVKHDNSDFSSTGLVGFGIERSNKIDNDILSAGLDNKNANVRRFLMRHARTASSENLHKALNDSDSMVQMYALAHPDAKDEHFDTFEKTSGNNQLRLFAAQEQKRRKVPESNIQEDIKHIGEIAKGKTTTKLQHGYLQFRNSRVRVSPAEAQAIQLLHNRLNKENRAAAEKMLRNRSNYRKLLKFAQDPKIAKSINK